MDRELVIKFIDAAVNDHVAAGMLLREHPDLLNARYIHGETVLHFLAIEGLVSGVQFLVASGADVDAINEFGDTALIDVAALGNREIAEILLKYGANPNAQSDTRDNVLAAAIRSGNQDLVDLLRSFGSNAI